MKVITSIAIFLSAMPSASARVKSVGSSALRGLDITYAVSATDAATTSGTWYMKQGKCIDDGLNTWQELYDTQVRKDQSPESLVCVFSFLFFYIILTPTLLSSVVFRLTVVQPRILRLFQSVREPSPAGTLTGVLVGHACKTTGNLDGIHSMKVQ